MAKSTRLHFIVTSDPGRSSFPLDMLRYDACWPLRSADVYAIQDPIAHAGEDGRTSVTLAAGHKVPTLARWASFGWHVTSTEAVR